MSAKIMFGVRMSEETKNRLFDAAKAQNRTASNLAELVLIQYLDQISKRSTSSPTAVDLDFASMDTMHSVLGMRRPAIADTLHYLEDK